jgi:pyruvate,water dikinase
VHDGSRARIAHRACQLEQTGKILAQGIAVGGGIAVGTARRLDSPEQSHLLQPGDVLGTGITNPDWDPIMKKAAAIVTDKGGRTSHAAIVARELGLTALVGTGNATETIRDGQEITVSCAEGETGHAYEGRLPFTVSETDAQDWRKPRTKAMLILGDPDRAFQLARLPSDGIGLMRMEFIINSAIRIHPVALAKWDDAKDGPAGPDKEEIARLTEGYADKSAYFVDKLAEAVGTIAAAFHPREVIVRMSDFKTNEYANLLGGRAFEPHEENPMIGFRGAARYYHPLYRDGFRLECLALHKVREKMGLHNVKVMIPFCRSVEEAAKVEAEMAGNGLKRGENGLELYAMVEIPSNVLLLHEYARHFDGFSIGSNDLTQLTLGIDRDSALVSPLFSESNPAVKELISRAIHTARRFGRKIGLCGQAPSDDPAFARFLVENGIDSISFNPDALHQGMINMCRAETLPALPRAREGDRSP